MQPVCLELPVCPCQLSTRTRFSRRRTTRCTDSKEVRQGLKLRLATYLLCGSVHSRSVQAFALEQPGNGAPGGGQENSPRGPTGAPADVVPKAQPPVLQQTDVPGAATHVEASPSPSRSPVVATPPPARWPVVILVPAAVWGVAWAITLGLLSLGYAALASAACIAAAAFGSLAPGAAASGYSATASSAAAVAAVDWVDVAFRTAAGLAANSAGSGAAGRAQVLATMQEANTGPLASWAVEAVLPGLCALAGACGTAAAAVRSGFPWLEAVAHLAASVAGLGVLLVLALPLRPYLAPLLPVLTRERPSTDTWRALSAGGAVCMVAVLTSLQMQEVQAPVLAPSIRSAAAAAAASSPLLLQTQAVVYGMVAVVSDLVLPACTAVLAARFGNGLLARRWSGRESTLQPQAASLEGAEPAAGAAVSVPVGAGDAKSFRLVKALAACRLLLDGLLLLAVTTGVLPGKISAMRILGMLWLLQTAAQL